MVYDLLPLQQSRQASGTTHPLHTLLSHHIKEQFLEWYHLIDIKKTTTWISGTKTPKQSVRHHRYYQASPFFTMMMLFYLLYNYSFRYRWEGTFTNGGKSVCVEYSTYKECIVRVIATYSAFLDSSSLAPLYKGRITISNWSPLALWYVRILGNIVLKSKLST